MDVKNGKWCGDETPLNHNFYTISSFPERSISAIYDLWDGIWKVIQSIKNFHTVGCTGESETAKYQNRSRYF